VKSHYLKHVKWKCKFSKIFNRIYDVDINKTGILYYVCLSGKLNLIKYLIEHGADIKERNRCDKTLLDMVCENENEYIVKNLIELGYKINNNNKKAFITSCMSR